MCSDSLGEKITLVFTGGDGSSTLLRNYKKVANLHNKREMPRQPIDALAWVSVGTDLKVIYSSEGFDSPIILDRTDRRNI